METLNLTTTEVTPEVITTNYKVVYLMMDWENKLITIRVRGTNGEIKSFLYEDTIATNLMTALNKIDLTIKSLHRRILERLNADGYLIGSVEGVPD